MIMENKKQYVIPLVELWLLNTAELMRTEDASSGGLPPGPATLPAPRREPEVF